MDQIAYRQQKPTLPLSQTALSNTCTEGDGTEVGSRFETSFTAGTSYRIGLVNGAADTHFRFTINNHIFEVVVTDFVPIVPYNTTNVRIALPAPDAYALEDDFAVTTTQVKDLVEWTMAGICFISEWDYPTVLAVAEGNTTWTTDEHVIELSTAGEWVYFVIQITFA
ncbi:hypothetical protein B7494_g469 [Chlorociboria aeruginascens]|nr:hypothetical protein B7494_g469 [Chlorociboria aeruginascens]